MDQDDCMGLITRESINIRIRELYDPLTGLFRPPYIQMIYEHTQNDQQPCIFIFIDINNFGEIKYKIWPPVGDDIIVGVR